MLKRYRHTVYENALARRNGGGAPVRIVTLTNTGSATNDAFVVKYNTSGKCQWAAQIGGTDNELGYGVAADSSGNVYVTGVYDSSSLKIYNQDGSVFATITNDGPGAFDIFVVKYNTSGTPQWARHIGASGTDYGYGISVDSSGNAYVVGTYGGGATATIYNANGSSFTTLANAGGNDAFLVKYDTSGTPQWATHVGGTGAENGYAASADSSGNIYIAGSFSSSPVTIYNTDGSSFTTLANAGGNDAFLVKYNTSGVPQWTARIADTGFDNAFGISVDASGNVYVTGSYGSTPVTVYNANGTSFTTLANPSTTSAFIVKYNSSGAAQWGRYVASGASTAIGRAITADGSGNVYVTGYYDISLNVYLADGVTVFKTLANSGGYDAFIVKYNTSGTPQWATRVAGTGGENGWGISTDSSANVYLVGQSASGTISVYDTAGTQFTTITNTGSDDAFLVKYDTSGSPQWAVNMGGTASDLARAVSNDSAGNIYITGTFISTIITYNNT